MICVLVRIFPYLDSKSSYSVQKYGLENNPYLDTFCVMKCRSIFVSQCFPSAEIKRKNCLKKNVDTELSNKNIFLKRDLKMFNFLKLVFKNKFNPRSYFQGMSSEILNVSRKNT